MPNLVYTVHYVTYFYYYTHADALSKLFVLFFIVIYTQCHVGAVGEKSGQVATSGTSALSPAEMSRQSRSPTRSR